MITVPALPITGSYLFFLHLSHSLSLSFSLSLCLFLCPSLTCLFSFYIIIVATVGGFFLLLAIIAFIYFFFFFRHQSDLRLLPESIAWSYLEYVDGVGDWTFQGTELDGKKQGYHYKECDAKGISL